MTKNKSKNQSPLKALLEIIEDSTSAHDEVCEAAQNIAVSGDSKATEPLLHRLTRYTDPPWVRRELVIALGSVVLRGETQNLQARNLLLELLSSTQEDTEVRAAAAIALGQIGDKRAVEPLLILLDSKQADLTYACVAALENIGDPKAIDALITQLKSDRFLVPQTAAKGLAKFGKAAERALPALKALADNGSEAEQRYAAEAIASITQDAEAKGERSNSD